MPKVFEQKLAKTQPALSENPVQAEVHDAYPRGFGWGAGANITSLGVKMVQVLRGRPQGTHIFVPKAPKKTTEVWKLVQYS